MKTSESVVKIYASAKKVWQALTVPGLVKQWQFGSELLTTWDIGTPIVFRNEWNGQVFEQQLLPSLCGRNTRARLYPMSRTPAMRARMFLRP